MNPRTTVCRLPSLHREQFLNSAHQWSTSPAAIARNPVYILGTENLSGGGHKAQERLHASTGQKVTAVVFSFGNEFAITSGCQGQGESFPTMKIAP